MTIEEIQQASAKDEELTQSRDNLQKNKPHKLPSQYKHISEELYITDQNSLLRGNRIVLRTKEQSPWLMKIMQGWQNVNNASVRNCDGPRWTLKLKNTSKPVIRSKLKVALNDQNQFVQLNSVPEKPWIHLAINVCGPLPTGESVVVLTDYYSRWPERQILKSIANILAWLDEVFATHGYPYKIKSDNASYFTSHEFHSTLKSWGAELKPWPNIGHKTTAKWNASTKAS